MAVRRIVANIAADRLEPGATFYRDVLGLAIVMDLDWIVTFAADGALAVPQISLAVNGGSGTDVPDLSVEVDDFEAVLARARASGFAVEYGPVQEPWGVRRFYVRDPFGRLVNVLTHS